MRLARPIHIESRLRVLHEEFKWRSDIARNINSLNFTRAEIYHTTSVVVRDKHNIDITGRLPVPIIESYFNK